MTDPTPPNGIRGAVDLSALVQRPQQQDQSQQPANGDRKEEPDANAAVCSLKHLIGEKPTCKV